MNQSWVSTRLSYLGEKGVLVFLLLQISKSATVPDRLKITSVYCNDKVSEENYQVCFNFLWDSIVCRRGHWLGRRRGVRSFWSFAKAGEDSTFGMAGIYHMPTTPKQVKIHHWNMPMPAMSNVSRTTTKHSSSFAAVYVSWQKSCLEITRFVAGREMWGRQWKEIQVGWGRRQTMQVNFLSPSRETFQTGINWVNFHPLLRWHLLVGRWKEQDTGRVGSFEGGKERPGVGLRI